MPLPRKKKGRAHATTISRSGRYLAGSLTPPARPMKSPMPVPPSPREPDSLRVNNRYPSVAVAWQVSLQARPVAQKKHSEISSVFPLTFLSVSRSTCHVFCSSPSKCQKVNLQRGNGLLGREEISGPFSPSWAMSLPIPQLSPLPLETHSLEAPPIHRHSWTLPLLFSCFCFFPSSHGSPVE